MTQLEQLVIEAIQELRGDGFTADYYSQQAEPFVGIAEWHAAMQIRAAWQDIDRKWATDPASFGVADCLRLLADRW